jgi:hypothetical protein
LLRQVTEDAGEVRVLVDLSRTRRVGLVRFRVDDEHLAVIGGLCEEVVVVLDPTVGGNFGDGDAVELEELVRKGGMGEESGGKVKGEVNRTLLPPS